MRSVQVGLVVLFLFGILLLPGESQAVIYKYLDEKGDPVYVDDLAKVPEPVRKTTVIVTGKEEQELTDDAERARAIAGRQADGEQRKALRSGGDTLLKRLLRSGMAAALIVIVLVVMANLDALKERIHVVRKVRIALIGVLVLFLGFTHASDVMRLFWTVEVPAPSTLSDIKERQAEKGKKAVESYKNRSKELQEKVQAEADRIQNQSDEAERGK